MDNTMGMNKNRLGYTMFKKLNGWMGLAALGFARGDKTAVVGDNRPRLYWSMCAAQSVVNCLHRASPGCVERWILGRNTRRIWIRYSSPKSEDC